METYILNISVPNSTKKEEIGYYSEDHPWKRVSRELATTMNNKDCQRIRRELRKLGFHVLVETIEENHDSP